MMMKELGFCLKLDKNDKLELMLTIYLETVFSDEEVLSLIDIDYYGCIEICRDHFVQAVKDVVIDFIAQGIN